MHSRQKNGVEHQYLWSKVKMDCGVVGRCVEHVEFQLSTRKKNLFHDR